MYAPTVYMHKYNSTLTLPEATRPSETATSILEIARVDLVILSALSKTYNK